MTAAEDESIKGLLNRFEELTELSIKEAMYINEHTVKMACGAPLEREELRLKAAKAIKLRSRAILGLERIIHDEPDLVQSFCAKAAKGTMISVEEVIEILSSKTANGYTLTAGMRVDGRRELSSLASWKTGLNLL